MVKYNFGNNQDTRNNNQTMTNNQIPITKQNSLFGNWLLEFGICLVIVSWLLVISVLSGCGRKEARDFKKTSGPVPVKVMKVELKEIAQTIDYAGNVKAQDEAFVYPKVSGKLIEKVKEDGSKVEKGEVIAYIDRDEVGLKFEKAPVESPIAGVIGRVFMDIGSQVNSQTQVALVMNMDKMKIDLHVPEKYLPLVSLGQEAKLRVDAYPDEEFIGRVAKISPMVDLSTRAAPIEIIVENPGHNLKSGMFARVSLIIRQRKDAPVILKEALIGREPELYVYVVEDDKAVLKKVAVGIRQGPYYEVTEGLSEGESVVIVGKERLREGAEVAIEEKE